jgi:tripartite-type tricarboxylate transporter receptor subunit TctC
MSRALRLAFLAAVICCQAFPTAKAADAVEDFYKSTQIRLIIGVAVGGSYDTMARLVTRHLGRHIPGNPRIVAENMPGASGRLAANHIATVAARDGSVIAAAQESLPLAQAMGESGVRYDASKFFWIGNPVDPISVLAVWHEAGVKSIEDAKHKEVTIGATSSTGTNYLIPRMINDFVGTKFKIITGYSGGNAIDIALERGEVQGRGSNPWKDYVRRKPEWTSSGKIIPLVQMTLKKHADLPNVPRLIDLAPNEQARRVFELYSITSAIGRPLFTPPEVPADRVAALRRAFDLTMKDPEFLADAEKSREDIDALSGGEVQALVARVLSTPKETVESLRKALDVK